jgi:ABC-2 type transport system permease protein
MFTRVIETLRGLLMGTPIGNGGVLAVAWCVGIGLFGYLWARRLFNRDPSLRSHSPGCNVLVLKS